MLTTNQVRSDRLTQNHPLLRDIQDEDVKSYRLIYLFLRFQIKMKSTPNTIISFISPSFTVTINPHRGSN